MARRPSLIKTKQKKPKKSQIEQRLVNRKAYGDEPIYTSKLLTTQQLTSCYNWYNYMCDQRDAKEYLLAYLNNSARYEDYKRVEALPDRYVPTTVAWLARMRSQGANLPESSKKYFDEALERAVEYGLRKSNFVDQEETEDEEVTVDAAPKTTVRSSKLPIDELEERVDSFLDSWTTEFSMIDWLRSNEVSRSVAKKIHDFYNPQLLEIERAYLTEDKEGYESLFESGKLKLLYGFFVMIVEDLELHVQNEVKARKPRAKKPVSIEKKLKDFKYLEFDPGNNIRSIAPEKILGAMELWVYNRNYQQLTVFRSSDPKGLDVYRTSITNFSEQESCSKKIRAKDVADTLRSVVSGGKLVLRRLMSEMPGAQQKLPVRVNDNVVLLRVMK